MQSHSCVLGQIHGVIFLCPGFLSGLFSGSSLCGPTPVSWVLVWFVLWLKFMRSYFCVLGSCMVCLLIPVHAVPLLCVLGSCLVCLRGQLYAVLLLCPGFLSGLSHGSDSRSPTLVSWVLVCSVLGIHFTRSNSCVLDFDLVCLIA